VRKHRRARARIAFVKFLHCCDSRAKLLQIRGTRYQGLQSAYYNIHIFNACGVPKF